ncbi:MAG TPA: hypothetical protein VH595_14685 [Verrucomicrobiae bacterium]|jgi:hypothetical protein|nr:hypothetical protein [Verrucomicrobiae bacterium]
MDDTDFDILLEGLAPPEAKRLRKLLTEWCDEDEGSFPVQLALLTRAQWRAAAEMPVLLKQSLELLDRKLAEFRQQTAALLINFNSATDAKTKALERIVSDHKDSAQELLDQLQSHTTDAHALMILTQDEIGNGASELKRLRDDFVAERLRLYKVREEYEAKQDWRDGFVLVGFIVALIAVGVLIGWRFPH